MSSLAAVHPMPMPAHNLRPKKPRKAVAAIPSTARSSGTNACDARIPTMTVAHGPASAHIKKPMRPLTAYHIFFQIEREYIIQTSPGADADSSMHDRKSYLHDVPRRYRSIRLLPDWYAGPGKRQKRKHRKSHGKIGFLELSRVISKRWATLESSDPETKRYVTMVAARELDGYKVEMEEYKILCDAAEAAAAATASSSSASISAAPSSSHLPTVQRIVSSEMAAAEYGAMISPSSSPSPPPVQYCMPVSDGAAAPDFVRSLDRAFIFAPSPASPPIADDDGDDEIDYSICRMTNSGNYVPSCPPAGAGSNSAEGVATDVDGSFCDPLFQLDELEDEFGGDVQQRQQRRCVSPVSSGVDVDGVAFDPNFLEMLSR